MPLPALHRMPRLLQSCALALLVALPTIAHAQGGRPGGGRRGGGPPGSAARADSEPTVSPEERARFDRMMASRKREMLHPVGLVLAHRGQLAISDSQAAALEAIRARYDARIEPMQQRIDSLRAALGDAMALARSGGLTDERREEFRTTRLRLNEALEQARDDDRKVRAETWSVLSPDQQVAAQQVEAAVQRQLSSEAAGKGSGEEAERRGPPGGRGGRAGPGGVGSVSGPGGPPSR